jgi:hypothetical protein
MVVVLEAQNLCMTVEDFLRFPLHHHHLLRALEAANVCACACVRSIECRCVCVVLVHNSCVRTCANADKRTR